MQRVPNPGTGTGASDEFSLETLSEAMPVNSSGAPMTMCSEPPSGTPAVVVPSLVVAATWLPVVVSPCSTSNVRTPMMLLPLGRSPSGGS